VRAKGYCLQANEKTREGAQHPDRDAQFEHINPTVAEAIAAGQRATRSTQRSASWSGISRRSAASLPTGRR
jgi:hypothetical protein